MTPRHAPNDRTLERDRSLAETGGDQLYLLTLCLELQLDLLLVALRPESSASARALGPGEHTGSWARWVGQTLDLTGDEPVVRATDPGSSEPHSDWLAARYTALLNVIDEMLGNAEVRRNPVVVDRLFEARATCDGRLASLRAPKVVSVPADSGPRIEAGHFLG